MRKFGCQRKKSCFKKGDMNKIWSNTHAVSSGSWFLLILTGPQSAFCRKRSQKDSSYIEKASKVAECFWNFSIANPVCLSRETKENNQDSSSTD